ncbi:MAG TPA: hypothetical protein VNR18_13510 [Hyphomicrobiales bacterium]|nr:hypothetical protein [Hyphomicrobiales bacterium]
MSLLDDESAVMGRPAEADSAWGLLSWRVDYIRQGVVVYSVPGLSLGSARAAVIMFCAGIVEPDLPEGVDDAQMGLGGRDESEYEPQFSLTFSNSRKRKGFRAGLYL